MTSLSNLERDFILKAIQESKRLDGRQPYDYRHIKIEFGVERGCCFVHMGNTRVMAQTSSEVIEPKGSRPTEGQLFVNMELSPMASPAFEAGRLSDYGVELNRLLERTIKESRAVDLESLCIVAGEKVWQIRLDVHVLNHDGSILDCASVAAITALSHFRRPDVTVIGESVTIHSPEDRDPVPLNVHHIPLSVTFAFYDQGSFLLVDPTEKEEGVMEGTMVVGMNIHRELCTMQVTGSMLLLKEQILRCCQIAVVKVSELTELIKTALDNDTRARAEGKKFGLAESFPKNQIVSKVVAKQQVDTPNMEEVKDILESSEQVDDLPSQVEVKEPGLAQIGEGLTNSWMVNDEEEEDDDDNDDDMEGDVGSEDDVMLSPTKTRKIDQKNSKSQRHESDDSEEEETVQLRSTDVDVDVIPNRTKSEEKSGGLDLTVALKKTSPKEASQDSSTAKTKKQNRKWKKGKKVTEKT